MDATPGPIPWVQDLTDGTLKISVSTDIYPLEILFRTCYTFTDRCYLFLEPDESQGCVHVSFAAKDLHSDLRVSAGEFSNELVNQRLRRDIAAETKPIRELIVAQAFAEAEFRAEPSQEADYHGDPKGIAR